MRPEAREAKDGPVLLMPDIGEVEKGGERRSGACPKLESAVDNCKK